jgi:YfiH family protein
MMSGMALPQPNDSFRWVQVALRPALVCEALRPFRHVMTTREWELGSRTGSDEGRAWSEVEAAMGGALRRIHQVHGTDVAVVRRADGSPAATVMSDADIIVSDDPSVAIAIQTADCVPLLIADRRIGAVAAAHAGWRGLAAGVPGTVIDALAREFSSRPSDLVVAAGPSIGSCCYEVGPEVRERFAAAGWPDRLAVCWFFDAPRPTPTNPSMPGLRLPRAGHWFFDGSRAARDQLEAAGVPRRQIFLADLCTASHAGMFCSYRRDGRQAGRMAAAIRASIDAQREVQRWSR